ncbi:MAG: GH3 auxin-responsive promoter family protein, partial [Thaumarchaeota archaeon]
MRRPFVKHSEFTPESNRRTLVRVARIREKLRRGRCRRFSLDTPRPTTERGSAPPASEESREFRSRFPTASYADLLPQIGEVREGRFSSILPEPVARRVMTRGSTGLPKVIPVTETHLSHILSCGARAVVNFALKRDPRVLETGVLNLNFPSEVSELDTPSCPLESVSFFLTASVGDLV